MASLEIPATIYALIEKLPDSAQARLTAERLFEEHPAQARHCIAHPALLANVLTLAAYSPLLAETMLRQPDYITWLGRERDLQQIKSKERLLEELARFAARQFSLEEQIRLARFKRRELLRIYLRDCLGLATLTETTEELSNLADVLLERALGQCYQRLVNRFGAPLVKDARGRTSTAEFSIISLGKLGSKELNYASDIDLLFLFSEDGMTAGGQGRNTSITNKEFFIKLAESVVKLIGSMAGEGAVYRIDLRLRPHGRDGTLAVSLAEAVRYYREKAQNWERQSLIKARCSAGSERLFMRFWREVETVIYRPEPLPEALRDVRTAKEKIDHNRRHESGGYNVKLGKGGIREIEFIVQALQLYHGGRDPWVRSPQTLIGLERLADKGILSTSERMRLSEAYKFLRTAEHRLQMEYGVQTHSLPTSPDKLAQLARRMGYPDSADAAETFLADLETHRSNVSAIYNRVFAEDSCETSATEETTSIEEPVINLDFLDSFSRDMAEAERLLNEIVAAFNLNGGGANGLKKHIVSGLSRSLNPLRGLKNLNCFAASLATYNAAEKFVFIPSSEQVEHLSAMLGTSQYFSQILINRPLLACELSTASLNEQPRTREDFLRLLKAGLEQKGTISEAMATLRRNWYRQILRIGLRDTIGNATLRELNLEQTALAIASLEIACEIALAELATRYKLANAAPTFTILGLGRLGHSGIDYGSDLDIVFVHDDRVGPPAENISAQEFYSRFIELLLRILSAMTRDGFLYRVDLRLRPAGGSGMLTHSLEGLRQYLLKEAATWEHLAYIKARPVVGSAEFGREALTILRESIFERNRGRKDLANEAQEMRERLQRERAGRNAHRNIKFGVGGMMDVYFATRYLQLCHSIADPDEPGTLALINHLRDRAILNEHLHSALYQGYSFLRKLDHLMRLLFDRPTPELPSSQTQLIDLARAYGFGSTQELENRYAEQTARIRSAYCEIVKSNA